MGIFDLFKKRQETIAVNHTGVKPVVLVILDGWGVAPPSEGNAITSAKTPNFNKYMTSYPHGELLASGESVGLPANEVGNTEVGHLNLGAGRLILQDLKKINKSIEDGSFYYNKALRQAREHIVKHKSKFHIFGLIGGGHVHSSIDHLYALLEFCKRESLGEVYLHLFTDGRDSPPQEGIGIIKKLEEHLKGTGIGKIATISGRYFAMDRDKRWDRTQKTYKAIVLGKGLSATTAVEAIQNSYNTGKSDEFIEPTVIMTQNTPIVTVNDNDAVVFFNFRIDRPRQLTMAFVLPNFENLTSFEFGKDPERGGRKEGTVKFDSTFKRDRVPQNVFFVTMTEYDKNIKVSAISFPPETVENSLPQVISSAKLRQLHISESEKERFVTYYFDGLKEEKFSGEDTIIIPSPKVATYDQRPEMSIKDLVWEFKKAISKGQYHFFIVNIANPDMVAHTGNLKATIRAVETSDLALGDIVEFVLSVNGTVILTADHGNAEELLTYPQGGYFFTTAKGEVNTDHSTSPVPVAIIKKEFAGQPKVLPKGTLADIAPTILSLMNLQVPTEMTGKNLLK